MSWLTVKGGRVSLAMNGAKMVRAIILVYGLVSYFIFSVLQ
jgi:hypothetical protein